MQPDCRPPAEYFLRSITVNPGGLQYIVDIIAVWQQFGQLLRKVKMI